MQTFGNYLKKQRDERMISLKEVALLTNITERYLDFIEKDDYEKVPEGPFIRGYISSYATAIGIDAHETLDRFDALCKERNRAEDIQPEISKGKIGQASIAFLVNRRCWFFLLFAILILLTFGIYHFFSQDQQKAHAVANLQGTKDKGLQATLPMKSEDNVSQFSLKNNSMSTSKQEDLQKDAEHRDYERIHDVPALNKELDPKAEEPSESADLPSLPSDEPLISSKQTSNIQEMKAHSQNTSKVNSPAFTTFQLLEHHNSGQIVFKKKASVQRQKIPKSKKPLLGVISGEQTGAIRMEHENNVEVLKATVCTDVKDRIPSGEHDSVQWSVDRVYIWNLIKCEGPHSSIRHVYYFKGKKVSDILLDIKSPLWRTWSYKKLLDKRLIGPWRVDITLPDGGLLQRVHFEVH